MLKFEDVRKCKDVAELNLFIGRYLEERDLAEGSVTDKVTKGVDRHKTYWALFCAWKDSLKWAD
jgi:hypothetical protein